MAVYYVDSAIGNNSNAGTSTSAPWLDLTKVNATTFSAGDQILFNRGQVHYGMLQYDRSSGSSGNPITFGAYGSGAKPQISSGLNLGTTGQWSVDSGSRWKTGALDSTPYDLGMVYWGQGSYGVKKWDAKTSVTAQGNWFYDMAANILYLYSASNPATYYGAGLTATQKFGSGYTPMTYIQGVDYITFQNIDFRDTGYHALELNGCDHIIVDSCEFHNVGGGDSDGGDGDGYGIQVWDGATDHVVKDCIFMDIFNYGYSLQSGGSTAWTWNGIQCYRNTFIRMGCGAFENWYSSSAAESVTNVVFSHNTAYDLGHTAFKIGNVPYAWTISGSDNDTFTGCKIVDNIFANMALSQYSDRRWCYVQYSGDVSSWAITNNCYYTYNDARSTFANIAGTQRPWSGSYGWHDGTNTYSKDANSITTDPLFANVGGNDFQLTASSPCRGIGVDDGLSLGYFDLGAYAYAAATSPTVTSLSPSSGSSAGGTFVTITGTNLTGASWVNFGSSSATGVTAVNASTVTCTAPSGTGTVDVTVTTPNGTSPAAGAGNDYTYTTYAPSVSGLSPNSGPAAGGTAVTITGTYLTGATGVSFGGTAATSVVVVNATTVTCVSPAGTGTVDITVTTPGGTSDTAGTGNDYTYTASAPTVTGLSPSTGYTTGGTPVSIGGTNLTGATSVRFGTEAATSIVVVSSTSITCRTPAHAAGVVDVTVTTASGTSAAAGTGNDYTYTVADGGDEVSILGVSITTGYFADRANNVIGGGIYTAPASGVLDNPWCYFSVDSGGSGLWKIALYNVSGSNVTTLVAQTGAMTTAAGSAKAWRQAVWTSAPTVVSGTKYALLIASGSAYLNIGRATSGGAGIFGNNTSTYPTLASPFPSAHTDDDSLYRLYATILTGNVAPNAPAIVSPTGGATIDYVAANVFTWTFSDPNPGDTQSAYQIRYKVAGATSWTTMTAVTSPASTWTAPGSTFSAGNWEWQVLTRDAQGLSSPWSASGTFTATTVPATPTITAPVAGGTVTSNPYTVTWSCPDQGDGYQVRTVRDNSGSPDTGTVYQDTGLVADSAARSVSMTFGTNSRYEHVQVRVKNSGTFSSWASVRVQVSWTAPATPTVAVTANSAVAYVLVVATHPTPSGSQPAVSYEDIYRATDVNGTGAIRIATHRTPHSQYRDYAVSAATNYYYQVKAVATTGTTANSAWVG
jgi:hypothetical protein